MERLTKKELKALRHEERVASEAEEAKKKKMKNYAFWTAFVVLLIACIGLLYYIVNGNKPEPKVAENTNSNLPPVTATDYQTGPNNAKVTLIEYGDFQCPACGQYYPMVEKLREEYKDSLRFVYRNFPLVTIHKNALLASRAAYAAGKQGKFWEMYKLLFENQQEWAEKDTADQIFAQYAVQLQLNPIQFTTDMMSEESANFITAQTEGGTKTGIQGTPTFFINGRQMTNPTSYEEFKAAVENSLRD